MGTAIRGCLLLALAAGTIGPACRGHRSGEVHHPDEGNGCWMATSPPEIQGPKVVVSGSMSDYTLTAVQPNGCPFTFRTFTADCTIDGARLRFSPKAPGTVKLRVVATTTAGATSTEGTLDVEVQPAAAAKAPDSSASRP